MVSCLLTSQQKSGPQSPINRFMLTKPFPLNLAATRAQKNVGDWIVVTLSKQPGIRFANNLARYIGSNFVKLEDGWWPEFMSTLRTLDRPHEKMDERRAAHIIDYSLKGFGPKQARNLLQCLGLTQHETPLDSRVVKWLKGFGLPAPDSVTALGKADSYDAAMDSFQQIAMAADIPLKTYRKFQRGGHMSKLVTTRILVAGVVLLVLAVVAFSNVDSTVIAQQAVQHYVVPIPSGTEAIQRTLDQAGRESWVLVALEEARGNHFIFIR